MRIEYERACKQAGLPEEQVKAIRRMFDADYKRLKRRKKARENYTFFSLEYLWHPSKETFPYHIVDPDADVERIIFHKLDLERLNMVLERIPERDKEFILDCFDADWGGRKPIAEKYGMTLGAIKQKKRRVLERIRTLFFEEEEI